MAIMPNRLNANKNKQPITAFITTPQTPFFLTFNSQHEKIIRARPNIMEVMISRTNANIPLLLYLACPRTRI